MGLIGHVSSGHISNISNTDDFYLSVAKGDVPGHSIVHKFGENPDIDGVAETVWDGGGLYVPPTQARIHNVASTLAADAGTVLSSGTATGGSLTSLIDIGATFQSDGVAIGDYVLNDSNVQLGVVTAIPFETEITIASSMISPNSLLEGSANDAGDAYRVVTEASTGASIYHINGLDASLLPQEEFVVLNGGTNVPTVKSWLRQFRARVFGPNTTGAAGNITATAVTDGTVTSQITDGSNQTLMAVYTIPSNKIGYLNSWWCTLSRTQSAISNNVLRIGNLLGINYILQNRTIVNTGDSQFLYLPQVPIQLASGIDIWVNADTNLANTSIASGFDIILVDK